MVIAGFVPDYPKIEKIDPALPAASRMLMVPSELVYASV